MPLKYCSFTAIFGQFFVDCDRYGNYQKYKCFINHLLRSHVLMRPMHSIHTPSSKGPLAMVVSCKDERRCLIDKMTRKSSVFSFFAKLAHYPLEPIWHEKLIRLVRALPPGCRSIEDDLLPPPVVSGSANANIG